jgi:PelA/Pel-15E family pectate lyase
MSRTLRRAWVVASVVCGLEPQALYARQASEGDGAPLVSAARIATLPAPQRRAWTAYLAQSRADRLADSAVLVTELKQLGSSAWTTPPVAADFRLTSAMSPAWFATDSAARIARTMLSFQTTSGGWAKHVDMFGPPRAPGQSYFSETRGWDYIATIDNGATVGQLRFLARRLAVRDGAAERAAFVRGVRYLLRAQYPSGGWPQVYPLQGGYHDATTYNDDATVAVLRLLGEVRDARFAWVPAPLRAAARAAVERGIAALLADQVIVNGHRTVWGQQHDPFTRQPVRARSYELAGLTGGESAGILELLMTIERPSPAVQRAVHAGVAWLVEHPVVAVRYDSLAGSFVRDSSAAPTWARIYEVPSFRPIMANRDGVTRYEFAELTDRRTEYAWYVQRPSATIAAYAAWAHRYPMSHQKETP